MCFEDEKYDGFLQKTRCYSRARAKMFGDLKTVDHKVVSEGCESSARTVVIRVRGRHQHGWEKAQTGRHVEEDEETL